MNVMDLVAKIGLDNSEFDKNLTSSENKFSGFGKTIASGAKTIGKVGVATFAAVGTAITGATTALIKNAGETAAYADQIDKASQKLGFSAEAYQEWDFILQHSGSSIDSVKGAMIKLQKAAEGGGEAFEKLGINQEEFLSMSNEQQFETAIQALQGVEDETERARLAQDMFGKSYMELMPLINTSAEETAAMKDQVHELGGVMSDDAVKAGAAYQDSLKNLQTAFTGLKNNMMGEFLPGITTVMDGLTALLSGDESGIGKIKEGINSLASTITKVLPQAIQTVSGIAEALLSALPQVIDVIGQELPGILERAIPLLINALVSLADAVVEAIPKIMDAIEKNINVISDGLTKIMTAIGQIFLKLVPKLLPVMLKVAVQLIKELAKGFSQNASEVIRTIVELIDLIVKELTNPETLSTILSCGLQIILAIAQGILDNLPQILESLLTVITNILGWFVTEGGPMILAGAGDMFEMIGEGILKAWDFVTQKLGEFFGKILGSEGIGGWGTNLLQKGKEAFENIGEAISQAWETVTGAVTKFGEDIWNGIKDGLGDLFQKGVDLVMDVVDGIKSVAHKINEAIWGTGALDKNELYQKAKEEAKKQGKGYANSYVEGQEEGFDIHSPSKKMQYIGEMVMRGFANGIEDESGPAFDEIDSTFSNFSPEISVGMSAGKGRNDQGASIRELMDKIDEFMKNRPDEYFPIYFGTQQFEEFMISGKNRIIKRSGGQVNA